MLWLHQQGDKRIIVLSDHRPNGGGVYPVRVTVGVSVEPSHPQNPAWTHCHQVVIRTGFNPFPPVHTKEMPIRSQKRPIYVDLRTFTLTDPADRDPLITRRSWFNPAPATKHLYLLSWTYACISPFAYLGYLSSRCHQSDDKTRRVSSDPVRGSG